DIIRLGPSTDILPGMPRFPEGLRQVADLCRYNIAETGFGLNRAMRVFGHGAVADQKRRNFPTMCLAHNETEDGARGNNHHCGKSPAENNAHAREIILGCELQKAVNNHGNADRLDNIFDFEPKRLANAVMAVTFEIQDHGAGDDAVLQEA